MKRTIVIGDLHGCYEQAKNLLDKCKVTNKDQVIFLGDLVDRGEHSGQCVELAMEREKLQGAPACILGNHEEKHLFYEDILARKGRVDVQIPSHVVTRSQLTADHYNYFRRLPKYLRLPEYNAVCVHAGVYPGRSIEAQTDRHLLHVQMICPYDADGNLTGTEKSIHACDPKTAGIGWGFWTNFWAGPERIIFGHSVLNKPLVTEFAVGIDGGACFGRELWALVLPDWEIVSVKGLVNKDDNSRRARATTVYIIKDDVGTY